MCAGVAPASLNASSGIASLWGGASATKSHPTSSAPSQPPMAACAKRVSQARGEGRSSLCMVVAHHEIRLRHHRLACSNAPERGLQSSKL